MENEKTFMWAIELIMTGGWTMVPLFLVGISAYVGAFKLLRFVSDMGHRDVDDATWAMWIQQPESSEGETGRMIRYIMAKDGDECSARSRCFEVKNMRVPEMDRRIGMATVWVSVAPLLGLLGTVFGMIKTFNGLSAGGNSAMDVIASGISEALVTTEMGLLIAIPGYVLVAIARARKNEFVAFMARIESCIIQDLGRLSSQEFEEPVEPPRGKQIVERFEEVLSLKPSTTVSA
ncbi:MAG: MotA/TolQ/ExbB proton channel family protein [Limisphaerales bacterium]